MQLCHLVDRLTFVTAGGLGGAKGVKAAGKHFEYRRPGEKKSKAVRPRDLARHMLGR